MPHIPFTEFGKGDGKILSPRPHWHIDGEKVTLPSPSLPFGTVDYTTVYVSQFFVHSALSILVTLYFYYCGLIAMG